MKSAKLLIELKYSFIGRAFGQVLNVGEGFRKARRSKNSTFLDMLLMEPKNT